MVEVDENYHLVLKQLTDKINGSRYKVSRVANTELLGTYWEIGRTLLEQREKAGWGKKIIEKLVNDLKAKFPNMKGLSQRNLEYMQTFASAWPSFPFRSRRLRKYLKLTNLQFRSLKLRNYIIMIIRYLTTNSRYFHKSPGPTTCLFLIKQKHQLSGSFI